METVQAKNLDAENRKIIVLDDDPTGIQTVHDVYVYTDWREETLREAFQDENNLFFILTNSRSFSEDKTRQVHAEIAANISRIAKETGKDFLLISRGDSTLRGHYPLETEVLKETLEENGQAAFDGEILCPFFVEGGRVTIDGIHYLKDGEKLIPVGESEFAKDRTFGYESSDLGAFVEEKTQGAYLAADCVRIGLDELRAKKVDAIVDQLMGVTGFNKVLVDSTCYEELEVFAAALAQAIGMGKRFIIRSAAGLPKVIGEITDRSLLKREELTREADGMGGIVLIGSHVKKTTEQLACLQQSGVEADYYEFDAAQVKVEGGLEEEVQRIIQAVEANIVKGRTSVVYTSRKLLELDTDDKEKILEASVKISDAVTSIIGLLNVKPRFILAKGGITSSDVGTKALRVKKAKVMGQIKPGIPVWLTGEESKFPHTPYIIFPGNVGSKETLKEIVEQLV